MIRLAGIIGDPGTLGAVASLALQVPNGPGEWVGFSGPAMLVVGGLLSTMATVVTFQARQLDKEREKVLAQMGERLVDRDRAIEEKDERIAYLENVIARKDEQIFRVLGLAEGVTQAAETLAPLAPLARRAGPRQR